MGTEFLLSVKEELFSMVNVVLVGILTQQKVNSKHLPSLRTKPELKLPLTHFPVESPGNRYAHLAWSSLRSTCSLQVEAAGRSSLGSLYDMGYGEIVLYPAGSEYMLR